VTWALLGTVDANPVSPLNRIDMAKPTILILIVVLSSCRILRAADADLPPSLVLVPLAIDVKSSTDGFRHDGCTNLDYMVQERYPGKATLTLISEALQSHDWSRQNTLDVRWARGSLDASRSVGKWAHFTSVGGTTTYVREEQWHNKDGSITSYLFRYIGPDLRTLHVQGRYCPVSVIEKYRCTPGPLPAHDDEAYSLELKITKIEQMERNFKIFVQLRNNGLKPVLLGVNGTLPDGAPELWVLGLEQRENGNWSDVDAVCPEHPAFDWISLKPGEGIESWVIAVDFDKPDQYFAKCRRKIGHLKLNSDVRAVIRYYVNACEIEQPLAGGDPYLAASEPSPLLESR